MSSYGVEIILVITVPSKTMCFSPHTSFYPGIVSWSPIHFFGVNATIRDGLHIAEGSLIAMGACVLKDTEPWGVYKGSPAKKAKILSKDLSF